MTLADLPLEALLAEINRRHGLIHQHLHQMERCSDAAKRVCEIVAETFQLPVCALWDPGRPNTIVQPRQAAMAIMYDRLGLTLEAIGHIFHLDHGTVIHARKAHQARIETQPAYADKTVKILNRL